LQNGDLFALPNLQPHDSVDSNHVETNGVLNKENFITRMSLVGILKKLYSNEIVED
jgi:hypothetical protein